MENTTERIKPQSPEKPEYFKITQIPRINGNDAVKEYYMIRNGKAIGLLYYGDRPTAILRANPERGLTYYEEKNSPIIEKLESISALDFEQILIRTKNELINI
jgi:hypothetical protein